MTQVKNIIKHMERDSINPLQALRLYGCFRLASRIVDIKALGYNVLKEMTTKNKKRFATYSLGKKIK